MMITKHWTLMGPIVVFVSTSKCTTSLYFQARWTEFKSYQGFKTDTVSITRLPEKVYC
ncbi:hypothetical protein AAUPMB_15275 [Pasteurella multocida subsp. multocida str. Anand1_buffalo]|nr:hypothetical protein AAUPMB_15275 [Pasteurella multocida subsp. multocida str. Anand1_buffalo]